MSKIFHLSFLLDRDGFRRIDLISFYELSKLDDFIITRFKNTHDVRKKYQDEISEFCLDNRERIQKENAKNKRNWTGSITIIADERDNNDKTELLYKIPIIYQDDQKLLSKEECLRKIKEALQNQKVIKRLFTEKRYLLSQYEIDLLFKNYNRSDDKYLRSFIGNFYNRMKNCNEETFYYYCRSLMHVFDLNKGAKEKKSNTITHINEEIPLDTTIIKKNGFSSDFYFNDLISMENYEELFNIYSVDEIEKNSNMFVKRKK